ncbi:MAG: hypothetical protein Q7S84_03675 [bacterium]|nr:hypothetical protein [bacterium]
MEKAKHALGELFAVFLNASADGEKLTNRVRRFMSEQPTITACIKDQSNPWRNGFVILYSFFREQLELGANTINVATFMEALRSFNELGTDTIKDSVFERDGDLLVPLAQHAQQAPGSRKDSCMEIFYGAILCWWVFRGPKAG